MPESVQFTKFRVWEVVVPVRADRISILREGGTAYIADATWPDMPIHLVEGETNAGFTAVGESSRGESRHAVEQTLDVLLGRDLASFAPMTLWSANHEASGLPAPFPLPSFRQNNGHSYMIMETLWLDAMGKVSGLPAHGLLGGAVRDRVPVDFWANRPDAPLLEKLVDEAAGKGLSGIKLKSSSLGDVAHAVAEIASDAPEGFHFTIDPMCAWRTFRESRHLFEKLAKLGREIRIEDPFPHSALNEWRRAAAAFPEITMIWHARDEATLRTALCEEIGDALNLSGSSMPDFLRVAAIAQFHGRDCWQGSGLELGVLQHWRLHASACAPNCVLPSDLQSEWVRTHTLVSPRMRYEAGCAVVPATPGLGVSIDRDAIAPFLRSSWEVCRGA